MGTPAHPPTKRPARCDAVVAAVCGGVVVLVLGASFAAVPFYNWFCRTTGFNGTPQLAAIPLAHPLTRALAICFDTNVAPGMPWRFVPARNRNELRIAKMATVRYEVINRAVGTITAQATSTVLPPTLGAYFNKLKGFSFTRQTLQPDETREMAVEFYVDPAIAKDRERNDLNTITLSYTFYRLAAPSRQATVRTGPSNKL